MSNRRNIAPRRSRRNQPKNPAFLIKGSNPSPFAVAYDLRRCGRHFAKGIHNSVRLCGTGVGTLRTYESDDGPRATVSARHNCHSAWACPVCSPKIAAARQKILAPQVAKLIGSGYTAHLVTLTIRHNRGHDLDVLFDAMSSAWEKLSSGKAWKDWRNTGGLSVQYVRGVDLTWSFWNSWHPHLHIALYLPPGHSGDVEWFVTRWIKCLADQGFIALREAQDISKKIDLDTVRQAETITAYAGATARMPTAEAIGTAMKKSKTEGSFSPFEMLAKAAAGDAFFEARWKEYVAATKGRRQVTVSRGLKLSDDKDLTLADDVATLGPEAKEEIECSGMIPALLSAARCVDLEERRVSVASVLSRLEAKDWRILEPKLPEPLPPPDTIRQRIVAAWEVSKSRRRFRAMRHVTGRWQIDRSGEVVLIPDDALARMPQDVALAGMTETGVWVWVKAADLSASRDTRDSPPRLWRWGA